MKTTLPCSVPCRSRSGEERPFTFRCCTEADLPDILALQEEVIAALPDPSLFVRTTAEEITESLTLDFCIGAFYGETLAGFSLMVIGRITPRNLGNLLGYDEARLCRTVTCDTTFVSPRCRGWGLQRQFFTLREAAARSMGATEALTTISPDNDASLANAHKSGFKAVAKRTMYSGVERLLLKKEL